MWPERVGIKAIEIYFPALYVDQTDLEKFDAVSAGKYTVGLGQSRMGFCNDREDINSLCLTVLQRLMEKNNIQPRDVGRLEVGTETILDKSKSVKTVLMQLFESEDCTDIEGIDTTNACYGGTAALFNALAWVESSAYDGRLAIVVTADNAVYEKGSARPTGGAGAIAMVIGPDAPLVIDRGLRASCMRHVYDFYKPNLRSEYPAVDGKLSIESYLSALDSCYKRYCDKADAKSQHVTLASFDAFLFHSPYGKLVQKSFGRVAFLDFLRQDSTKIPANLAKFHGVDLKNTYFDRDIEKAFLTLSEQDFLQKTKPSLMIANQVGNMYTPSVYSGLMSLLISKPLEQLVGNKVAIFSYGSGLASSMYSLTITNDQDRLAKLVNSIVNVPNQLASRTKVTPEQYTEILRLREENCHTVPYKPCGSISDFFPGTYYLVDIDSNYRRTYERTPPQL